MKDGGFFESQERESTMLKKLGMRCQEFSATDEDYNEKDIRRLINNQNAPLTTSYYSPPPKYNPVPTPTLTPVPNNTEKNLNTTPAPKTLDISDSSVIDEYPWIIPTPKTTPYPPIDEMEQFAGFLDVMNWYHVPRLIISYVSTITAITVMGLTVETGYVAIGIGIATYVAINVYGSKTFDQTNNKWVFPLIEGGLP